MEKRTKNWPPPRVEHGVLTKWNWVVMYPDSFKNGVDTDIGSFTAIQAQAGVEIGDRAEIGPHCAILSVSTISSDGAPISGKVVIGEDAMIGSHCTIMPGVTIGQGAIVGAHSFVKHDVPAHAIVHGVPAKFHSWRKGHEPA